MKGVEMGVEVNEDIYDGSLEEAEAEEVVETEEVEELEEVDEEEPVDPWDWAKDLDPNKVKKTWNKFTESWDEVIKERDQLAPLKRFKEYLEKNPKAAEAIDKALAGVDPGADEELARKSLEQRLDMLQNSMAVEKEIESLKKTVSEKDWVGFNEEELIQYAAEGNFSSLSAAYKDKYLDDIIAKEKKAVEDKIKKNAESGVLKTRPSGGKVKSNGKVSMEDLEDMSDAEFAEYIKNNDK